MTDDKLKTIGVTHAGHRKRLLIAASKIALPNESTSSRSLHPESTISSRQSVGEQGGEEEARASERRDLLTRLRFSIGHHVRKVALGVAVVTVFYERVMSFSPVHFFVCLAAFFIAGEGGVTFSRALYIIIPLPPLYDATFYASHLAADGGADNVVRMVTPLLVVATSLVVLRPLLSATPGVDVWGAI